MWSVKLGRSDERPALLAQEAQKGVGQTCLQSEQKMSRAFGEVLEDITFDPCKVQTVRMDEEVGEDIAFVQKIHKRVILENRECDIH